MSFLTQHPKLKKILIISEKQALQAILTSSLLASQWHFIFNWDNKAGLWALARCFGSVILGREIAAWLPSITKYANTDADPDKLDALDKAEQANAVIKQKSAEVSAAVEAAKEHQP